MKAKIRHALHGHGKPEAVERYIILGVAFGALLAGIGTAATVFSTQGIPAALALVGSFITFVFTVILVFYWLFRGDA
jgi:purine-cytosine permease-like protein